MTGVPDYIIIGAMKCGTTTLARQLGGQAGLFMTDPKEPNYFSDDAVFARGPDWYADLFATAAPGDLRGEASTHYTKLPDYPDTIARLAATAAENARFVYLIRDPTVRAVSHYIHEWTTGVIGRNTGFETAVEQHPEILSYGRYGHQIAPWLERFGPDRIHVDTLEAMTEDPQALLDRVGAFLGRTGLVWDAGEGQANASAERLRQTSLDRWLLQGRAVTWLRRTLVPQSVRDRVKAGRRLPARPTIPDDVRARMEAVFLEDRAVLHGLFPDRPDLDRAYPFASP
ncbi:sulfotransferase domain-containing protein [Jannaschia sp. 2305UL9-9]|uniref:sulfotransferase family protein n=1 Tax=Jannaschia sp. 2305UL9-9 TaxID=3121638 RepID=UPI003528B304